MFNDLSIKIFSDGANLDEINKLAKNEIISGITTNPTLMRNAGVTNYLGFCNLASKYAGDKPISLEVFSDEIEEMYRQAHILADINPNVFVKIPITNSKGIYTLDLVEKLTKEKIKVNVTGILSFNQVKLSIESISSELTTFLSIFAGRIADTGRDPMPIIQNALELARNKGKNIEFIWASTREVLNVYQAASIKCHIITCTPDIIKKLKMRNKDLEELSLETVQMFYSDALKSGFKL